MSREEIAAKIETLKEVEGAEEELEAWEAASEFAKETEKARAMTKEWKDQLEAGAKDSLVVPEKPQDGADRRELEAFLATLDELILENQNLIRTKSEKFEKVPEREANLATAITKLGAEIEQMVVPPVSEGAGKNQRELQRKRALETRLAEARAEREVVKAEAMGFADWLKARNEALTSLRDLRAATVLRVEEARKKEAEETAKKLEEAAADFSSVPVLARVVAEVAELSERRDGEGGVADQLKEAEEFRALVQAGRDLVSEQYRGARDRIKLLQTAGLGIDDETGLLLRRQRASLPGVDGISDALRGQLEKAAQAQIELLDLTARINQLPVLSGIEVDELLQENPGLDRAKVQGLLDQHGEMLRRLAGDFRRLNGVLVEGTEATKMSIAEVKAYSQFIDERLLWIRSVRAIRGWEFMDEWRRVLAIFSPTMVGMALISVREGWLDRLLVLSGVSLMILVISWKRRQCKELLNHEHGLAVRRNCTKLAPTLRSVTMEMMLALWLPLIFVLAALLMDEPESWRTGFWRVAVLIFSGGLISRFARPGGLFEGHFKMATKRARLISATFRWLIPAAAPFLFLLTAMVRDGGSHESGRVIFLCLMVLMLVASHRLFHPSRSILGKAGEPGFLVRVGYGVSLLVPLVLGVAAALGYFASVLLLKNQMVETIRLFVLAYLLMGLLKRWALVSRRDLAIKQALQRREATIAERARTEKGEEAGDAEVASVEELKARAVDVVEVEEQTKQLLRVSTFLLVGLGLWAIWASILPALSVFDRIYLWGGDGRVTQVVPVGSEFLAVQEVGDEAGGEVARVEGAVSLQDFLLAILTFVMTFVAARNIPGLLSLSLFSKIELGPGGNFALTTTVRYVIVLLGVVSGLGYLGITWGSVQWLAAAISLGIGFGLQEIFANFVAGIIMLYERPIRLGDIVTVGEISGRVTEIKIRATTIRQFNNRELLVPNKEFITSQLVNWTLRDSVLRFESPVGVAYGSDTEEVREVLEKLLMNHAKVLKDPSPTVLFMGFGDSTLDFEVRGFVGNVGDLLETQSDLNFKIERAFREAGIEIAFPQRDIHVRSLPEGFGLSSNREQEKEIQD